jgi:hypothetical protein
MFIKYGMNNRDTVMQFLDPNSQRQFASELNASVQSIRNVGTGIPQQTAQTAPKGKTPVIQEGNKFFAVLPDGRKVDVTSAVTKQ